MYYKPMLDWKDPVFHTNECPATLTTGARMARATAPRRAFPPHYQPCHRARRLICACACDASEWEHRPEPVLSRFLFVRHAAAAPPLLRWATPRCSQCVSPFPTPATRSGSGLFRVWGLRFECIGGLGVLGF